MIVATVFSGAPNLMIFTSHYRGSLIRNFRTVLNDNVELQLDRDTDEPAVFIRDMVLAFGPQDRRPLGW